jgi:hypothetical protein
LKGIPYAYDQRAEPFGEIGHGFYEPPAIPCEEHVSLGDIGLILPKEIELTQGAP